ncbi:hypothetical protein AN639_00010 [Candidatus Epulonipiscium fishelsonii]|uniref:Uncharacterized protein n=2 Tax=Candidatus Epulonipiscium fishelsonii TaxID=77094 RepID=A0ACC8XCL8_9FIRM|nr:hypothetical protein AN396_05935 [Epulopiscium sp. SCG-B11WGA-EpuloA1]ONI41600.1 hypothetical protein AN396_03320 [Epulopiscium sp. SCG-B11WGA-EpuloA1]ONI43912.1 hypothetical protein AN639_00010 [Epulopiscium sp. SCG-B05WGA-EpuloA1]
MEITKMHIINPKDKKSIILYKWEMENTDVKGVVHIVHGAFEHAKRYDHFARFLASRGYIVFAHNQRGHGEHTRKVGKLVDFGEGEGFLNLVRDVLAINKYIRKEYPKQKLTLLGHSMGSFVARYFAINYSELIDKLILVGTGYATPLTVNTIISLSSIFQKVGYSKKGNKFLEAIVFGQFNLPFLSEKDILSWLTSSAEEREKNRRESLGPKIFTTNAFKELFKGVKYISEPNNILKTRKNLPVYIISGEQDTVGQYGKGVRKVYQLFKEADILDVEMKIYKNMRHEILNEQRKHLVYRDVLKWISK